METLFKDKNGDTKYWANMGNAWNAAAKLNADINDGMWVFEHEYLKGWFLIFKADND